jgi:hypothetical protein
MAVEEMDAEECFLSKINKIELLSKSNSFLKSHQSVMSKLIGKDNP